MTTKEAKLVYLVYLLKIKFEKYPHSNWINLNEDLKVLSEILYINNNIDWLLMSDNVLHHIIVCRISLLYVYYFCELRLLMKTLRVSVYLWCSDAEKKDNSEWSACVSSSVCVSMSFYGDRTNNLSCHAWPWESSMDLKLHQPGGALWLSSKLPVCLFPHQRLAKQQGTLPLPRVRSL